MYHVSSLDAVVIMQRVRVTVRVPVDVAHRGWEKQNGRTAGEICLGLMSLLLDSLKRKFEFLTLFIASHDTCV